MSESHVILSADHPATQAELETVPHPPPKEAPGEDVYEGDTKEWVPPDLGRDAPPGAVYKFGESTYVDALGMEVSHKAK